MPQEVPNVGGDVIGNPQVSSTTQNATHPENYFVASIRNAVRDALASSGSLPDSHQIYGNFIASKLRTYSLTTRLELHRRFNDLLDEADCGFFNFHQYLGMRAASARFPNAGHIENIDLT